MRIHDLTAEVSTHMPVWPTNPLPVIEPVGITSRDGYAIERISAMTHTGTHIDAPYHFIDGGGHGGRDSRGAPCLKRVLHKAWCEGGEEISRADLERVWDRRFRGSAILIDTGWSRRRAFTKEFLYGFPGLSEDAADFLLSQEVGMVGIDTLGIEPYSHHGFEVHKRLLSAGVS
ncbi:cyclase family protein [Thermogymnomonas acidicola]|uniref:cyclase family protein n=1 Tax=Thermogymnomonas acidicola TaxID=399579 RepID=UPI000AF5F983|nr:cyclase family protein [Thermogymnomonas acidicola]